MAGVIFFLGGRLGNRIDPGWMRFPGLSLLCRQPTLLGKMTDWTRKH